MTASDPRQDSRSAPANDDDGADDTAPEIAADDAGASAMAERKGKESDKRKEKP